MRTRELTRRARQQQQPAFPIIIVSASIGGAVRESSNDFYFSVHLVYQSRHEVALVFGVLGCKGGPAPNGVMAGGCGNVGEIIDEYGCEAR